MLQRYQSLSLFTICALILFSCQPTDNTDTSTTDDEPSAMEQNLTKYVPVKLTTDLTVLTENQKKMIPILIEAANIMDGLFWKESYGDKAELMAKLTNDGDKKYAAINYGPWDRLGGDSSFIAGIGEKPKGAQFYPGPN